MAVRARTALALGLPNLLRIAGYRLGVRVGWNPVRRLRAAIPEGPFFEADPAAQGEVPAVAGDWWEAALYFGRWPVPTGPTPPDWHLNPLTHRRVAEPLRPWWEIPDFDATLGDIKPVWEASRFDWSLSFAERSVRGDPAALGRLNDWLSDWCRANPPYRGANWKCGQEASIRVMHLAMAAMRLGSSRKPTAALRSLLRAHLDRILPTRAYAMAQDNNHGTSEAAALYIGGSWLRLAGETRGARIAATGRRMLEERVGRLVAADGSFSQYSLNYHRMMLDTLCMAEAWRRHVADAPFGQAFQHRARAARDWLHAMIDPETGDGPNLGANDGANLLQRAGVGYRDYRATVHRAARLFPDAGRDRPSGDDHDLLGASQGVQADGPLPLPPPVSRCMPDGGYGLLRGDRSMALLRFPRFRFRPGQADALHVDLWVGGVNLLRDAGTYGYNVDREWLDYFGGTRGHNTIQFDDRDQMPRLGRFLFGDWLRTTDFSGPLATAGGESFAASYRDGRGAFHRRTITLGAGSLRVDDEISGFARKAVLRWRLQPGPWQSDAQGAQRPGHRLRIDADVPIRRLDLVEGWESLHYLDKTAVPVLEAEFDRPGRITTLYAWD